MVPLLGLVLLLCGGNVFAYDLDIEGRIFGGQNATIHAPYMVRIHPFGPKGEQMWTCGGALINTTLILTTASCMYGALSASVMAGSPDRDADKSYPGSQWSNATQIYYYPDFLRNTMDNDIALIRVNPPFNTTETVNMIQLAKSSLVKDDAQANKSVIWTSYGMINGSHNASGLQYALVKPIKKKACEGMYRPGPYFIQLPKTVGCLEPSTTIGMCDGDGASVMMVLDPKDKVPGTPYLYGFMIRNPDMQCPPNETLSNNMPDIFVKVDPFYKWILAMGGPKQS